MKLLSDLISVTSNRPISSIHLDSREVRPESLFIAISGSNDDGSKYISDAISKGAIVIVHDSDTIQKEKTVTYIKVSDSRLAAAEIAEKFYDNPTSKLKLVGVTGTNGKTTTATLLYDLFESLGHKSALISTIENRVHNKIYKTDLTTPDPITISRLLNEAVLACCEYAFMECSSHAIDQKRIVSLNFALGIFTNLTQDHLDYHKNMQSYFLAKKKFFDQLTSNAFALSNADDLVGKNILENCVANKYFYSLHNQSDFKVESYETSLQGSNITLSNLDQNYQIHSHLFGLFNVYNIVSIFSAALLLGVLPTEILSKIARIPAPKGRLEPVVGSSGKMAIVDYSHTPDALEKALLALRNIAKKDSKIICVFGCGGSRDKSKRKLMGSISEKLSDYTIITSDNPREENPFEIINDIKSGFEENNFDVEENRSLAIKKACLKASSKDIILVAGKGHEDYQIIGKEKRHFSDFEELEKYL